MSLGLLILSTALGTLIPEASSEGFKKEFEDSFLSQPTPSADMELSKKLALVETMIKDLEKQNSELKELQEKNAKAIDLEISAIHEHLLKEKENQIEEIEKLEKSHTETVKLEILALNNRLFEEKQQYLQIIKELQKQNLDLQTSSEKNAEVVQLEIAAINERLLTEREKHAEEIERLKEAHAEAMKLEISAVNERLFEEKKQHLNHMAAVESDLALTNKKVSWLDERAKKKITNQVGDLLATAALPDPEMEPAPKLPVFCYRPDIKKAAGYIGIEFLWWKAYEGALDYAIKGQTGPNPGNDQVIWSIGKLKSAHLAWDPGYRVFLGYRFHPDFWEVETVYTYYHSSNGDKVRHPKCCPPDTVTIDSVTTNPEKATIGTFLQYTNTPITLAKSSISLNYNMGDLLLARRVPVTDTLIIRGIFGASGLWLDQHWKYLYLPGDLIVDGVNEGPGAIVSGKENWKFSAGGMRLGIDLDWFIGKGFSLLTEGSAALFFGSYSKLSFSKTNNHVPQNQVSLSPQVLENLKIHDDRFSVHTRLSFMPAWGMRFDRFSFLLYAGYELNIFTNVQETYRSLSASTRSIDARTTGFTYGLLGMQGLTAGLKFDF